MTTKLSKKIQAAVDKVKLHIARVTESDSHERISIYTWGTHKTLTVASAIRVAEVSFYTETGPTSGYGSSYMQSDFPHGIAVCAAVERAVIALADGWPRQEIDEEFWRLDAALGVFEKKTHKRRERRA